MHHARSGPAFYVREIPFSYHGSWFNVSPVIAEKTYAEDLHLVSHQTGLHPVLRFVPVRGDVRVQSTVEATPSRLSWRHEGGRIDVAYESTDIIRVRGRGLGLRLTAANPELTPFSGTYFYRDPLGAGHVFTVYETGRRYRVTVLAGEVSAVGVQALGVADRGLHLDAGTPWEIAVEEYETARAPYSPGAPFDELVARVQAQFDAFLDAVAPWRSTETPAAALAAYVLWSATVGPSGFVTRPAVLMSKHWMDKVWSWDHCFNALALADGLPDLAWHQFQLPFDHRDRTGALPDSVTHSEVLYNFVKPPIHGWALRQLRERIPHLVGTEEAYQRLADWTTFWLTHRRAPGQPLAHYQHGNDSGWDNATTFDAERVVETADLATFLVLQMRELAALATELGQEAAAASWSAAAAEMLAAMLDRLWADDRFVVRGVESGNRWHSTSLLDLMPIVLGAELPPPVRDRLAAGIEANLTAYGVATEQPSSPHYQADGYWRGPIWAPATVLVEDGLRRAGHTELADRISSRYRRLCEKSGFAENFDAGTGEGLRDRAYTWTASSYLILAAAYERRRQQP